MKSAAPIENKYNVVGGDIYTFFLN